MAPVRLSTEEDASVFTPDDFPRVAAETAALSLSEQCVRMSLICLSPSVHGEGDHGLVSTLIQFARDKGVYAYVGDGANQWTAVHVLGAAHLYRLALEQGSAGARYHAVDEEGIAFRDIAEVIGRRLNISVVSKSPDEAAEHSARLSNAQIHYPASSKLTQKRLA